MVLPHNLFRTHASVSDDSLIKKSDDIQLMKPCY